MLISVIIPTYNRAHCIESCLQSVLDQTYENFEVILVDDGSTDNTYEVVQPYFDRIRYIHQPNRGIAVARNKGIEAAKGDWIALQDSDDIWHPGNLQHCVDGVEAQPSAIVHLSQPLIYRNHLGRKVKYFEYVAADMFAKENRILLEEPCVWQVKYGVAWAQASLIRADLLAKIGGYDTSLRIYTDYDLFLRLSFLGPWTASRETFVEIRREGGGEYVSRQRSDTPLYAASTLEYILENVKRSTKMQESEKRCLEERLLAVKRWVSSELLKEGEGRSARRRIIYCLKARPAIDGVAKYLISFLPRAVARRCLGSGGNERK